MIDDATSTSNMAVGAGNLSPGFRAERVARLPVGHVGPGSPGRTRGRHPQRLKRRRRGAPRRTRPAKVRGRQATFHAQQAQAASLARLGESGAWHEHNRDGPGPPRPEARSCSRPSCRRMRGELYVGVRCRSAGADRWLGIESCVAGERATGGLSRPHAYRAHCGRWSGLEGCEQQSLAPSSTQRRACRRGDYELIAERPGNRDRLRA